MAEVERNKALVAAFVDAINAQDWKALENIVAVTFRRHSHAAGAPGIKNRAELIAFLRAELETFPDATESIKDMIAEGNKVAVRHSFVGTQRGALGPYPPSGRTMSSEYIAIYRIEKEKIVEAWAEWDNNTGLVQLGHLQATAQPGAARHKG